MDHTHSALLMFSIALLAHVNAQAHEHEVADRLDHLASHFAEGAVVGEPSIVDCKLSDGTETQCFAITVTGEPVDHATGPFCPTNIAQAGSDAGGIWLENDEVYEVDGPFVAMLADFYGDPDWQLFDPDTGEIRITNSLESCQAAARPQVDPDYNNYCVQCEVSYVSKGSTKTYVVPVDPVAVDEPIAVTDGSGTGLAFNGVRIDGPAPRDAILAAHTLAPFDDCGGHVNLAVGYHYHAVTGCSTEIATDVADHAPTIGIALDGHLLHARFDADGSEPADLDACRGHTSERQDYHYHANDPAANAILPCHRAAIGCSLTGSDTACDATRSAASHGPRPRDHD